MTPQEFFGDWGQFIDFQVLDKCLKTLENRFIRYSASIYPRQENTFKAFSQCDYNNLRVVILGDDPYPQKGKATGLAFANPEGLNYNDWSPSLQVLYNAAIASCDDLPVEVDIFPSLLDWEKQGVLLLNSALTVEENLPGSHTLIWKDFIVSFLKKLAETREDVVFCYFGRTAIDYGKLIDAKHYIEMFHPAWFARNNEAMPPVFAEINKMLVNDIGKSPIVWL